MTDAESSLGQRVHRVVSETRSATGTNVNLGIALLLTPLVMSYQKAVISGSGSSDALALRKGVIAILESVTTSDSRLVISAIAAADAGGLSIPAGEENAASMDVNRPSADHGDLIAAMRAVENRDRIAWEYTHGYEATFRVVAPTLDEEIRGCGDVLSGISRAFLRLLAGKPDSLIARKSGPAAAAEVQRWAMETDVNQPGAVSELDRRLRSHGNQLNPGTTADLIAAGLFVLLCQAPSLSSE
jgi:triphosphoribosyl-dephospho-CoA synthase